jgi:SulP family sulfate permease
MERYIPALSWLKNYNARTLGEDALAGITVGVMLVPQGMAYALLAGLPPIYGLYAGIVPPLLYMVFGTSRQLSVGPVALVSLLVLSGLSEVVSPDDTAAFVGLAITTALMAGIIQLLMGVFRLGFLVNFLSHPVLVGFTSAAAVIIGLSQLGNVMGVSIPRSNYIQDIFYQASLRIHEVNWLTVGLSAAGVGLIFWLKKVNRAIPGALIAAILGTAAVALFGLQEQGVSVVGEVPKGLPSFEMPTLNLTLAQDLFSLSLTICIISFIESLAIAKTIEKQHGNYRIIPNQELIALGLSKVVGAFFQAFPTTGSFTRSAVNNESGAKTGISALFTTLLLALTLLFLTPLFYYLPKAILAAIIIVATIGLIGYKEAIHLWHTHRPDFILLMVTFLSTLILGIQQGVIIGVVLSIASLIYRTSKPHIVVLGRIPETKHFRNITRFPEAIQNDDTMVVRFDSQLYFGNANYFKQTMEDLLNEKSEGLKLVVLDASSIHDMDSSGAQVFEEVIDLVHRRGIHFYISGCIGPLRDFLFKSGLMDKVGRNHYFLDVHGALEYFRTEEDADQYLHPQASQTNVKK